MPYATKIAAAAPEQKWFGCALELKTLEASGVFAGYASVFDLVDSQRDVIAPGAFAETLRGRKGQIKLLWQHDQREPIGVIEEIFEDKNGLYVKGRLLLGVARAREAYVLMKEGIISGLSIGYSPRRFQLDEKRGVRLLSAIDLWEISLVTFPANTAARVSVVKGCGEEDDAMEWKQAVRCGHAMRFAHEIERAMRILRLA